MIKYQTVGSLMQVLLEDPVSCHLWELLIEITKKILSRWMQREILTVLFTSIAMGSIVSEKYSYHFPVLNFSLQRKIVERDIIRLCLAYNKILWTL